jgi:hypothetical protein
MTRPETFRCAWCGETKALKRTGRMPKFCSDACRKAPPTALAALANARHHLAAAQRSVEYYEVRLARYVAAIGAESDVAVSVRSSGRKR